MVNGFFSEFPERKPGAGPKLAKSVRRATPAPAPEKSGPAGGLPGKPQPKDRSGGVPRAKIHPKSEGI